MTLRALMIIAGLGAGLGAGAGPGLAQQSGSIELRVGGQDRNFSVLPEESGIAVAAGPEERVVTLMAVPEVPGEDADARLMIRFGVAGLSIGASASPPEIRYEDGRGEIWTTSGALTASLTIGSFNEIGGSYVVTGDFSSEMVAEAPQPAAQAPAAPSGAPPADAAAQGTVVVEGAAAPQTPAPAPAARDAASQGAMVVGTAEATSPAAGTPPQPQSEVLGVSGRFQATLTGE